jgi:integrase
MVLQPGNYRIEVALAVSNTTRVPSLRRHKPTGGAVVTLDGKGYYLGRFGSQESKAEYRRLLAEHLVGGRRASSASADLTVNELAVEYLKFADGYYVKNGKPTKEPEDLRWSIRPLSQLYGHTLSADFGPLKLKAVRQAMIDSDLCRNEINKRIGKLVRMFKWAASEEMVPGSVFHALKSVTGLRRGRSGARESPPVKPVPMEFVEAIRPFVSHQVWAVIQLQLLTGSRPGEICIIRSCDVDTRGRAWIYIPESHKCEHHDKSRRIYLGPKALETLQSWLRPDLEAYLFSPAEAMAEKRAEQRQIRKTPVQPSQRNRKKARPKKRPGACYDTGSYRRAIDYGCKLAGIPKSHPHQLRHNAATLLRREFNIDVARAVLGHSAPAITERYAGRDESLAVDLSGPGVALGGRSGGGCSLQRPPADRHDPGRRVAMSENLQESADSETQDDVLALALARGATRQEAGRVAGVSERTVYVRLSDPAFRPCVAEFRRAMIDGAIGKLATIADKAADVLASSWMKRLRQFDCGPPPPF